MMKISKIDLINLDISKNHPNSLKLNLDEFKYISQQVINFRILIWRIDETTESYIEEKRNSKRS